MLYTRPCLHCIEGIEIREVTVKHITSGSGSSLHCRDFRPREEAQPHSQQFRGEHCKNSKYTVLILL